ncbi:hypothetical protein Q5752_001814 [Cryptotrichosporon argae]
MAKSLRSKAKLAARRRKRDDSHYGVAEAARTARLSAKLTKSQAGDDTTEGGMEVEEDAAADDDKMEVEGEQAEKKISTSAPRGSRREEWRASKGMDPRPKSKGQNRLGGARAKVKAGRPKRRR